MGFIGKEPQTGAYNMLDALTASATASYSLTLDSTAFVPESANHLLVSLNGVIQKAGSSYTVSGSTLTFSSALTSSDSIDFVLALGNVLDIGTPSDATVTNAKTNFVSTSSAAGLQIKGDNTTGGTLQLNCEQNSHGIKLRSPAHSAGQSYTLTFPTGNVTADKFLKVASVSGSGTTGVGQLSFADAGGTLVQTGRTVISGGNPASVDVSSCFSSTYDTYLVVLDRIESTVDSQNLSIRLRNDSGSVTASNYRFANRYFHDASTTENTQSNAADKFTITNDTDDSSNNGGLQGIMYVHRPADANTMTRMNFFHSFFDATGNDLKISIGTCNYDNPEAHTGISLNISSGGVRDAGSITVYGIAYS